MEKKICEKLTRSDKAFRQAVVKLARENSRGKAKEITLKELCEAAGYTPMAFYYKYENKEQLVKQIIEDELAITKRWSMQFIKAYEDKNVLATTITYYEHIYKNQDLYYCLMNDLLAPNTMEYIGRSMLKWYKDTYEKPDDRLMNEDYYDMFLYLDYLKWLNGIKYWANRGFDIAPAEFAGMYLRYFDGYRPNTFPKFKIEK